MLNIKRGKAIFTIKKNTKKFILKAPFMKLLIPSLLSLFLVACGNDSSTSVNNSDDERISYITDSRDGQKYKTVTIGSQTWMAQNLNFETENSYCYSDDPSNCSKYGRLYTWAAAMESCPSGWHLPTLDEFQVLIDAVGGKKIAGKMLKATNGWVKDGNGTDAFLFSALPAGYGDGRGKYEHEGEFVEFWTATKYERTDPDSYSVFLSHFYEGAGWDYSSRRDVYSVRCLKDEL